MNTNNNKGIKKFFIKSLTTLTALSLMFALCSCSKNIDVSESMLEEIWSANRTSNVKSLSDVLVVDINIDDEKEAKLYVDDTNHIYITNEFYEYSFTNRNISYSKKTNLFDTIDFTDGIYLDDTYLAVAPNSDEKIISSLVNNDIYKIKTSIINDDVNVINEYTYDSNKKMLLEFKTDVKTDTSESMRSYVFNYLSNDELNSNNKYSDIVNSLEVFKSYNEE